MPIADNLGLDAMPNGSHKAMHWAARKGMETMLHIAEGHGHLAEHDMEFVFMCCFAAGAVWRDAHTDDPMILVCARDAQHA